MTAKRCMAAIGLLTLACVAASAQTSALDIKRAAPNDAFLVVYGKHNPERDYQQAYMADVWQTVQDERIVERMVEIVTSRMPDDRLAEAKSVLDEFKAAAAPINCSAMLDAQEILFFEEMQAPFVHYLFAVRLTSDDADKYLRGFQQLLQLIVQKSEGKVSVDQSQEGDASIVTLALPPQSPYQPAVARLDDIFIIGSNVENVRSSVRQIASGAGSTKFDDPRLLDALAKLPKAEDGIVFFDGRQLFGQLRGIPEFIKQASGNDPDAARGAGILETVLKQFDVIDYVATVEYTEGFTNRSATLGKVTEDAQEKLLYRALSQGEPFEEWQQWVPADAQAYSLSTGINMHVLYVGVLDLLRREVPESHEALDKWEALQQEVGVHLDRDILQSFSGETVSITLPAEAPSGGATQQSVTALKCENAERVSELLHRAIEGLAEIPAVQAQQLKLTPCEGLEGFSQLQATSLAMFGGAPVVGFRDGWMYVASAREAVERVLAVRAGEAPSIAEAESLKQFDLDADGDVSAVAYRDIGAGVRQAAQTIEQLSGMAPIFVGMAAANADPEDLKPVQEAIGLLPSIAKVVRKFDFMQHSLSITREGSSPDEFVSHTAMIIRQPAE